MPTPANGTLHGNDIDAEAVAWINENLPWVKTSLTTGLPPLPYPDDSFDLIYNHSVMTHLDSVYQDAWLAELRRVIRPGGIVTLTVSGPHATGLFLDTVPEDAREWHKEKLGREGIDFISEDGWGKHFPDFYHTTFHDVGYVFKHWSRFFDVKAFISQGALNYQDMVVLQKRVGDAAMLPPSQKYPVIEDRNRSDELELANAELRARLQQVYASRSWLLTKPWRYLGGLIKQTQN